MSFGARLLYIALLRRLSFINYNNGHVYLSTRKAADEIGANRSTIVQGFRELQHYGFLEMVHPGVLGAKGKATHWRITDMAWGQIDGGPVRATKDYLNWSGELFGASSKNLSKGRKNHPPWSEKPSTPGPKNHPPSGTDMDGKTGHRDANSIVGKTIHTKSHHSPAAEGRESTAEGTAQQSLVGVLPEPEPELTGPKVWTTPVLTQITWTAERRRLYPKAVLPVDPVPAGTSSTPATPIVAPSGAARPASSATVAGPPPKLDDLTIPEFLRRTDLN